jgi:hypothetical protein
MNVAFASPAIALAISVLPVPGGPYKSMPLGTFAIKKTVYTVLIVLICIRIFLLVPQGL